MKNTTDNIGDYILGTYHEGDEVKQIIYTEDEVIRYILEQEDMQIMDDLVMIMCEVLCDLKEKHHREYLKINSILTRHCFYLYFCEYCRRFHGEDSE